MAVLGMLREIVIGGALLFSAPVAYADDCLLFGATEDILGHQVGQKFTEVLATQNICAKMSYLPAAQSERMFINGQIDGELMRVINFGDYEQLGMLRIPIPVIEGEGLLVSYDPTLQTIKQMNGRALGVFRGMEWQLDISGTYENIIILPNYEIMVDMLIGGRVDAILIDSQSIRQFAGRLDSAAITMLMRRNVFAWIRPEHKRLLPAISDALQEFHASGGSFFEQTQ